MPDIINQSLLQENTQANLPYAPNNGNPNGANNMKPPAPMPTSSEIATLVNRYRQNLPPAAPNPNPPSNYYGGQVPNSGRYRPPTMDNGRWNDYGGYNYNLPNSFGSYPGYSQGNPFGATMGPGLGGMFAPMPNQQSMGNFFNLLRQMYFNNPGSMRDPSGFWAGGPRQPSGNNMGPQPPMMGPQPPARLKPMPFNQSAPAPLPSTGLSDAAPAPRPIGPGVMIEDSVPPPVPIPSGGGVSPRMIDRFSPRPPRVGRIPGAG